MKNNYLFCKAILGLIACFLISFSAKAQTGDSTATSSTKVTADLVSSYVWRGVLSTATPTPNFQPTLAFVHGGLEIGAWGSTDFIGSYKEADLYVSYATGPLKFTVTDYYWLNTTTTGLRYFNYDNTTTNHIFEGSVAFSGPQSFPVSIAANVMFAGADKKYDPEMSAQDPTKQAFSTYIELGYAGKLLSPFIGFTPADGYYGDGYGGVTGFNVVNIGVTGTKSLQITDHYALPLKATLGFNPQKEDIYLVFGITF
jgi:hypothetical protein